MPEYIRRPYKVHAEQTKKPQVIHTLEGDMKASPGDMIVTGRRGEKWPVKPGIFQESYRTAEKVTKKAEVLRLSDLRENPLNREIDQDKVAEIKRAITRTGIIKPLVYTEIMTDNGKENMLTDGHHRYVALKQMGYRRAPAVMADERGIDTANQAKPEPVRKAKRQCKEGYYRGKDGKCHRRSRYGYGGGAFIIRPKHPKDGNGNHNGHGGNGDGGATAGNGVAKHLQGQHDQSSHNPKTRRAEAAVAGTLKSGAIHLATLVVPAAVVGGLLRFGPRIGIGVIGTAAAFALYEVPQLIFRMIEGGYRGYQGDRAGRKDQKMMKVGNKDRAGQVLSRGDHVLVVYKDGANVGVHLGGDTARLLSGEQLIDVETKEDGRLKIATGEIIPSSRPENATKTKKVLNQLIREQQILLNLAHTLKQKKLYTLYLTNIRIRSNRILLPIRPATNGSMLNDVYSNCSLVISSPVTSPRSVESKIRSP